MEITKAKYIQFREQNSCIEAEVDGQTVKFLNANNREWQKIKELVKQEL